MKKLQKGFTLIELLVVIAIIGILSSVVLASLNTARGKGADAAAKEDLNNIRAQAEIFYDTAQTYTGVCADTNVAKGVTAAGSAEGVTAVCNQSSSAWAAQVLLAKGPNPTWYFCVDNTGKAATSTTALAALTACP